MLKENRDVWNNIALFESHDFVTGWYERRHGRALNAGWTGQITSGFRQAREYFESVASAGPAVKPLLLFYGCTALVQGALLALTPLLIPGSPPPSHGLSRVNWPGHLQKMGTQGVLDLGITTQSGLFTEFVRVVGNRGSLVIRQDRENLMPIAVDYGLPPFVTAPGQVITLRHLLQRDHRTSELYRQVTGDPAKAHRIFVRVKSRDLGDRWEPVSLDFHLFGPHPDINPEIVRRTFGPDVSVASIGGPKYKYVPLVNLDWAVSLSDPRPIPMLVGEDDEIWFSEDFENGDRLILLHRTFLCAFAFGMLARYHPATWMALLQNLKGAAAQPLIRASLDAVEQDFPGLVLAYLQ